MEGSRERRLRVDPRSGDPRVPVDDPSGGRSLSRRLARWLPVAFVFGLAIGIPLAFLADDWRIAVWCALGLAALVGAILAAIEDGRVQRGIDEVTRRRT